MDKAPVELWLPSRSDGLPECLLGEPLLIRPGSEIDSFFTLRTSSVWAPLVWGDVVRARPHPDGGYVITALGGAGDRTRVLVAHSRCVSTLSARATVAAWRVDGADVVETIPGLFVIAWRGDVDTARIGALVAEAGAAWSVVETWRPEERTRAAIATYLDG